MGTNTIKVHRMMCLELTQFVEKIGNIYPEIEAARPRCTAGLTALCELHAVMDSAKQLIQQCSESSKLYLAITADRLLLKCQNIQNALKIWLGQIQTMVPTMLEAKVFNSSDCNALIEELGLYDTSIFFMIISFEHLLLCIGLGSFSKCGKHLVENICYQLISKPIHDSLTTFSFSLKEHFMQISGIIEDLQNAEFQLESSEHEAGKLILGLLKQDIPPSITVNDSELMALRVAARKLKISTNVDVLVEKRCIKRVLNRLYDPNTKKAKIMKYLLNLLRKYGDQILTDGDQILTEDTEHNYQSVYLNLHGSDAPEPPQEFKCPISNRVMYDPVIIASGRTYERYWIEKWLNEGNDTCPTTHMRLDNLFLTPNGAMKRLISNWCSENGFNVSDPSSQTVPAMASLQELRPSGSVRSFASSLSGLHLHASGVSFRSSNTNSSSCLLEEDSNEGFAVGLTSLSQLASLPWESQCKALQNVKEELKKTEGLFDWIFPSSHLSSVVIFLKDAQEFCDVKAQKDSAEVILAILSKSRIEMPTLDADAIYMLTSFIDSEIREEALALIELLSRQEDYSSVIVASGVLNAILKVLDTQVKEFQELCMKILSNLSTNDYLAYHILFLDCISKLVPFLGDYNLAGYCLNIVSNLCNVEEGRTAVAETDGCISSIVKLLRTGTKLEQEKAVEILLSLCSDHSGCRQIVLEESNFHTLFNISVDGNSRARVISSELFQFLIFRKTNDKSSSYISSSTGKSSTECKRVKSTAKVMGYVRRRFARLFRQSH